MLSLFQAAKLSDPIASVWCRLRLVVKLKVMTKVHRKPRSFRLDEPDWDRLKIIALQRGYKSRYAFLLDQIKLIANASIGKAPDTV